MICQNLFTITGFACQPIDELGTLARISTPFSFADGAPVPVYVQTYDNDVHRFFDDGQTLLHFIGRGMTIDSGTHLRFLSSIAQRHGASLSKDGVLELLATGSQPSDAFAKYLSCLVSVAAWEQEHQGLDADGAAFATLMVHALMEQYPGQLPVMKPTYLGSSGKRHELDVKINGTGYIAVKPNQQSAAPALYKLVDITNRQSNNDEPLAVVVDDRIDKEGAKNTMQVFRGIASKVVSFSKIAPANAPPVH